jgi:uncharacterized protein DUF4190
MSQPPGSADRDPEHGDPDPWATPSSEPPPTEPVSSGGTQPGYGEPPASPPSYGQPPPGQAPYGQPPYGQPPYGQPPYGQPAYGQPAYGQPAGYPGVGPYGFASPPTNGKATAALWSGIALLVLSWCCGLGLVGIVPIVLGAKARSEIRTSNGQQGGAGIALAGIVTGAIAVVVGLLALVVVVVLIANGDTDFSTSTQTGV